MTENSPSHSKKNSLFGLFQEPPARPLSAPTPVLAQQLRHWRWRIMGGMMGGYALFYFVRKNLSMALPGIEAELGYSKVDLGLILTSASLTYGAGKFLNGAGADRSNARWFMATGLGLSALMNIAFGFSSGFYTFMTFVFFSISAESFIFDLIVSKSFFEKDINCLN